MPHQCIPPPGAAARTIKSNDGWECPVFCLIFHGSALYKKKQNKKNKGGRANFHELPSSFCTLSFWSRARYLTWLRFLFWGWIKERAVKKGRPGKRWGERTARYTSKPTDCSLNFSPSIAVFYFFGTLKSGICSIRQKLQLCGSRGGEKSQVTVRSRD